MGQDGTHEAHSFKGKKEDPILTNRFDGMDMGYTWDQLNIPE